MDSGLLPKDPFSTSVKNNSCCHGSLYGLNSTYLRHYRLGHISEKSMKKLCSDGRLDFGFLFMNYLTLRVLSNGKLTKKVFMDILNTRLTA